MPLKNKPKIIGITASYKQSNCERLKGWMHALHTQYLNAIHNIAHNTILPIIIPTNNIQQVQQYTNLFDGLILSGNSYDIHPSFYNEEPQLNTACCNESKKRTIFEIELYKNFIQTNKPLLGICGGMQLINIACGGSLNQDIADCSKHNQYGSHLSHDVLLTEQSKLHSIAGSNKISVNSIHHQSIKQLGTGLKVSATDEHREIEAIELEKHPFAIGVQWHPEFCNTAADIAILQSFIDAL
jgi:putative glutamine amidotransferase